MLAPSPFLFPPLLELSPPLLAVHEISRSLPFQRSVVYLCERCGRGDSVGESSVSKERRGSSQWKRENTRNEGRPEAGRKNLLNKYDLHSYLTLSRTCEVPASPEVHFLHAFGEHDLVDGARDSHAVATAT